MGEFSETPMPEPDFSSDIPDSEPVADIVEESPPEVEPAPEIVEEASVDFDAADTGADLTFNSEPIEEETVDDVVEESAVDVDLEPEPVAEPINDFSSQEQFEISPDIPKELDNSPEPSGVPPYYDETSDAQFFRGPEQTEVYHSPETTREIEPGVGPNPSWDAPPDGSLNDHLPEENISEDDSTPLGETDELEAPSSEVLESVPDESEPESYNDVDGNPETELPSDIEEENIESVVDAQVTANGSKLADDISSDMNSQIDQAIQSLSQIDGLDPVAWESLDANARVDVLQEIESQMATIQHRTPIEITLDEKMGDTTFGGWDGKQIRLNASHIESDMPVDEFIDTIIHEGRHAYQDYSIQNPAVESNQDLVNGWQENNQFYLDPTLYGQELYQSQPVEADAWDYASRIRHGLIVANWR